MTNSTETEVKLQVNNLSKVQQKAEDLGYCISQPRSFEANTLYDTADRRLYHSGMILRLRESGGRAVLTWKGREIPGPHKSRPERETTVGSIETFAYILDRLGFHPAFRYEKFRTELQDQSAQGTITLDETPIGNFIELEGSAAWIDETARRLEFQPEQYIKESYGALYRRWCQNLGVQPSHMVFPSNSGGGIVSETGAPNSVSVE
jgi:adenylate cyclase class 2